MRLSYGLHVVLGGVREDLPDHVPVAGVGPPGVLTERDLELLGLLGGEPAVVVTRAVVDGGAQSSPAAVSILVVW